MAEGSGDSNEPAEAGTAGFEAVAVEEVGVAVGAPRRNRDLAGRDVRGDKLVAYRGREVEEPVTRSRRDENAVRDALIRWERVHNVGVHFVAVAADSWPDRGDYLLRSRSIAGGHRGDGCAYDAARRAAPARVRDPNGPMNGVDQEDRQ